MAHSNHNKVNDNDDNNHRHRVKNISFRRTFKFDRFEIVFIYQMGRSYSKNKGQQVGQTQHRVATKEREEIKRTTKQKMARRHNREGGNHLDQASNRQTTMEDIDGGLHLTVDGQSPDETRRELLSGLNTDFVE